MHDSVILSTYSTNDHHLLSRLVAYTVSLYLNQDLAVRIAVRLASMKSVPLHSQPLIDRRAQCIHTTSIEFSLISPLQFEPSFKVHLPSYREVPIV